MGYFPNTYAVFGMMADKDIAGVMRVMREVIDVWHFTDLPEPRAATAQALSLSLGTLESDTPSAGASACFASVEEAYRAALQKAEEGDRIVVFGSFHTVAACLSCLDDLAKVSPNSKN